MVPDQQSNADAREDQRRRLETLGRAAGHVVHDFNNLLMVIDGYARMLLEESSLSAGARESVREILASSGRASELTRQLLAFVRQKPLEPVLLDVHAQLRSLRPIFERLLGERVELRFELADGPAWITAALGQLEQVLLNLIVNARDAMPAGGVVSVRSSFSEGNWCIEVVDNGEGIPEELKGRIFEPFFTTKPAGEGTGIGLSMVAEILAAWKGRIEVESTPGNGATFRLWIPGTRNEPAKAGAKILVVEDEAGVRGLIRKVLEQQQYEVYEASTEQEAVLAAQNIPSIDVLITDLQLRSGDGRNVAKALKTIHPAVKVLLISGYVNEPEALGDLALQKPFSPKTLVLGVQHLLKSN